MTQRPQWLLADALAAAAERDGAATAVVADGEEHTYAELLDAALRCARALQDLGVGRGERVVIQLENSWRCAVAILGTTLAGGTFVVLNAQTKEDKRAFVLDDTECAVVVAEGAVAATLPHVGGRAIVAARPTAGLPSLDELLAATPPEPAAPGTIPVDLAALIYTSGTTGVPKAVMIPHRTMTFATESVASYLDLDASARILGLMPLAVSYGLYQLVLAVRLGATVVLERSFAFPRDVLARVEAARVTVFPAVPTVFATLLALEPRPVFPAVTCVTNAGAALPPELLPGIRAAFPNARFFSMYGQTECKRASYLDPALVDERPLSVGKAIPGTEAFVLADDGRRAEPGEVGILHVRGPHVMAGYWRRPELTEETLVDGPVPGERMLRTGDLFRTDEDGFLYFVSRTDDVIISRGEKVSPVEVENAIYAIPGVREAAVVGEPDPLLGEAVVAYVAAADRAELTEDAVRRACRARLVASMIPSRVVFVDELPKTDAGKISRAALRGTASDDFGAARPS